MLSVLDKIDAKTAPYVVPVTNGFHVVPFPGMHLADAMAIRSGFIPNTWRNLTPVFVSPGKILTYLETHDCLAFPSQWSLESFKVGGEFLNESLKVLKGFQHELCVGFYSSKAMSKIRYANRSVDPEKKTEPKLVELYIGFLESTYQNKASSVVSEIRRGGISSAAYSIQDAGMESYHDWLTRTLGSKRSDPDKARNLRLLARSRR